MGWGVTVMEILDNHCGGRMQNTLARGQTERDGEVQEAAAVILAREGGLSQGAGDGDGQRLVDSTGMAETNGELAADTVGKSTGFGFGP